MGCIMKFRSANLYTIIIVTEIKDSLKKEKERVNGFFIFMAMPSLKFKLCHCSQLLIIQIWKWKQNVWQKPCHT